MQIGGVPYRTIWPAADGSAVLVIDQTKLPFAFETCRLTTIAQAAHAIRAMIVRGAPLIGATAAWGVALAMRTDASDTALTHAIAELGATRPTAVNLHWALERIETQLRPLAPKQRPQAAWNAAIAICDEDAANLPRHRRTRPAAAARGCSPQEGLGPKERRDAQHPHPLQCRLARLRRLRHGLGADLSGA
jgi:hypothetical protein